MGAETEYGSPFRAPRQRDAGVVPGRQRLRPSARARRARWDFEEETPLRDARGFDMTRSRGPQPAHRRGPRAWPTILTNGARLYVDHAHPEYSTPECTNPRDVVRWDKAGELVGAGAAGSPRHARRDPIVLYKNNTDNKGASYGTHENYLMRRTTPFADIVRNLTPFFVSRQVICGAGRVGIGQDGR